MRHLRYWLGFSPSVEVVEAYFRANPGWHHALDITDKLGAPPGSIILPLIDLEVGRVIESAWINDGARQRRAYRQARS